MIKKITIPKIKFRRALVLNVFIYPTVATYFARTHTLPIYNHQIVAERLTLKCTTTNKICFTNHI